MRCVTHTLTFHQFATYLDEAVQEGPADKCLALKSTVSVFQQPLIFVITDVVLDCLPISDRRIIFNLVERTLLEATLLWMTPAINEGRENEGAHLDRDNSKGNLFRHVTGGTVWGPI